ncbi:hypothetical protein M0D69_07260 [Caballeronia sp. SEWSISQ10-4 2]|uniref:hypothetical protein n=1 Tax=Caballeronia sp. SEWSISQ10-4 2 TaxID=2937438 RepID=UPI00264B77F8|nr:hypothetical protein [Caballeronia sp. SEWSISQ10-4 2]MDN7177821.1 hypothetical protein [Caballeronia sp. SEWSISQ10-4 2]
MDIKLFSDVIDALAKAGDILKAVVGYPKGQRDKIQETLNETYRLLDTTLSMVIIRLGDIRLKDEDELLKEAACLGNYEAWMNAEREFRLCASLRKAIREMETVIGDFSGRVSTKDWESLLGQMRAILKSEYEVAQFIAEQFSTLANDASRAERTGDAKAIDDALREFRESLIAERETLIKQELKLREAI